MVNKVKPQEDYSSPGLEDQTLIHYFTVLILMHLES